MLLKQEGLPYKRLCCLRQIIGEKKSLKLLIEMTSYALELLKCPSKEEASKKFDSLPKRAEYSPYIEQELLKINWP